MILLCSLLLTLSGAPEAASSSGGGGSSSSGLGGGLALPAADVLTGQGQFRALSNDRSNVRAHSLEVGAGLTSTTTFAFQQPIFYPGFIAALNPPNITLPVGPNSDITVAPYIAYQYRRRQTRFLARYDGSLSGRFLPFQFSPFGQHNVNVQMDTGNPIRNIGSSTTFSLTAGTTDVANAALSLGTPNGLDQSLGLVNFFSANLGTSAFKQFSRRLFMQATASLGIFANGGDNINPGVQFWQVIGLPADPTGSIVPQAIPRLSNTWDYLLSRRLSLRGGVEAQGVWGLDNRKFAALSATGGLNYRITPTWSLDGRAGPMAGADFDPVLKAQTAATVFPIAQVSLNASTRTQTFLGDSLNISLGLLPTYDNFFRRFTERADIQISGQKRFDSTFAVEGSVQAGTLIWVLDRYRSGVTFPDGKPLNGSPPDIVSYLTQGVNSPAETWNPLRRLPDRRASHHSASAQLGIVYLLLPGISLRAGATGSAQARWPYTPFAQSFDFRGAIYIGLLARSTLLG